MLRFRLGLLFALALSLAIFAFGLLSDYLFVRSQTQQHRQLLMRELGRIQTLVETSTIGASFLENDADGFILQFVSQQNQLILPRGPDQVLPLYDQVTLTRFTGQAMLVSSVPWRLPSGNEFGTIRLAVEMAPVMDLRRRLLQSLLISGTAIIFLALFISLFILRRALLPLKTLAKQAERLDPAHPEITEYQGPNDEVAQLAKALNLALDNIRGRQQAERDRLTEIAHEIAAPLSVLAGQLDALKKDDSRFTAAQNAAKELLYTSQDLLTLARGVLEDPFDLTVVDYSQVIRRMEHEYPGINLSLESSLEVLGNTERLTQLVRNLVRNAVQASGEAAKVSIHLRQMDSWIVMKVYDQGPGLSDSDKRRIFDRYYSKKRSLGVGLNVAQRIVKKHEGSLRVDSELGKGSCFIVSLPSLDAHFDEGF